MEVPEFNFQELAIGLALINLLLCGVLMAGGAIFGDSLSEKVKRVYIPNAIIGLVMVSVAGFIIGTMTS
jgi:hypothetical protein